MIDRLDLALEALVRSVPAAADGLEVSFAWPGDLMRSVGQRPTVNLFMWDACENTKLSQAGRVTVQSDDGSLSKHVDPYIDVHYLATVWCERERDEHRLIGQLLTAVLAKRRLTLPAHALGESARAVMLRVERPESRRLDAVWHGMDGRVRPALDVVATTRIDVFDWEPDAPAVTGVQAAVSAVSRPSSQAAAGRPLVEYVGHRNVEAPAQGLQ